MSCIEEIDRILEVYNRNRYTTYTSLHHFTLIYNRPNYINDFFLLFSGKIIFQSGISRTI